MMRRFLFAMILLTVASPAAAECFADYKAKRDGPLRLHYGVIQLPDAICADPGKAAGHIRDRLERGDWTLLNVVSVFGKERLNEKQNSAGEFFLRY